nr:MAG TPA: hypothetical protein [Caudoviricetes sp.]
MLRILLNSNRGSASSVTIIICDKSKKINNIYEIFADSVLLLIARHYSLLFWVWLCKMYFIKKITFFFNNRKQILA